MVHNYWHEQAFIQTFGHITIKDFITKQMYSMDIPYAQLPDEWLHESIKSLVEKESQLYKGSTDYILFYGKDDAEFIKITRVCDEIEVYTKRDGESVSWLEIGLFQDYQHPNGRTYKRWIKDEIKYPQRDRRLGIEKVFFLEYIKWTIKVALDYPLAIHLRSKGPIVKNNYADTAERTLWQPQ